MKMHGMMGPGTVLRNGMLWTGGDSTAERDRTFFREVEIISSRLRLKRDDDITFYGVGLTTDDDRLIVVVRISVDGEVGIDILADQARA